MYLIKKHLALIAILSLSFSSMSCSKNIMGEWAFNNAIDKLEESPNKHATINGLYTYELLELMPEKFSSKKLKDSKTIEGSYELINKYETQPLDDSASAYMDYLFPANRILTSLHTKMQENNYGGIEKTKLLKNHFVSKKCNFSTRPLTINYKSKGYMDAIGFSEPGYYDVEGTFIFDGYGYPIDINILYNHTRYSGALMDNDKNGAVLNGRLRCEKRESFEIKVKIIWEE